MRQFKGRSLSMNNRELRAMFLIVAVLNTLGGTFCQAKHQLALQVTTFEELAQEATQAQSTPAATSTSEDHSQYEVWVPSDTQKETSVFTTRNFALICIGIAIVYLTILLISVCTKQESDRESELTETFVSGYSESYYYSEEYTNSQYLKSDRQNSLVDFKPFKYDQSIRNSSQRDSVSNKSDTHYNEEINNQIGSGMSSSGSPQQRKRRRDKHHHSRRRSDRKRRDSGDHHQKIRKNSFDEAERSNQGVDIELGNIYVPSKPRERRKPLNYQPVLSQENTYDRRRSQKNVDDCLSGVNL